MEGCRADLIARNVIRNSQSNGGAMAMVQTMGVESSLIVTAVAYQMMSTISEQSVDERSMMVREKRKGN